VAEQEFIGLAVPEGVGRRGCRQCRAFVPHGAAVCACTTRDAGTTPGDSGELWGTRRGSRSTLICVLPPYRSWRSGRCGVTRVAGRHPDCGVLSRRMVKLTALRRGSGSCFGIANRSSTQAIYRIVLILRSQARTSTELEKPHRNPKSSSRAVGSVVEAQSTERHEGTRWSGEMV
jgi:hypothetical protein